MQMNANVSRVRQSVLNDKVRSLAVSLLLQTHAALVKLFINRTLVSVSRQFSSLYFATPRKCYLQLNRELLSQAEIFLKTPEFLLYLLFQLLGNLPQVRTSDWFCGLFFSIAANEFVGSFGFSFFFFLLAAVKAPKQKSNRFIQQDF